MKRAFSHRTLALSTVISLMTIGTVASVFGAFSLNMIAGQTCTYAGYGYDAGYGYGYGYECNTPIVITGGGGGGGGGIATGTNTTTNSCTGAYTNGNWYRNCAMSTNLSTVAEIYDNVACEGFFYANRGSTPVARKELAAVAQRMSRAALVSPANYTKPFSDVGLAGQASWIEPVIETNVAQRIIATVQTRFRPDAIATRSEAFSMAMAAVCLYPKNNDETSWQKRLWDVASAEGITNRTWATFAPNAPVLRQDFFVIVARVADWAERTGGCSPKPAACLAQ